MGNPSAWKRYVSAVGGKPAPDLARFAARYALASSFESVQFSDLAQATAAAYSSAMRCALAYSALESLNKSLGSMRGRRHLEDAAIAKVYRSAGAAKLRSFLEDGVNRTLRTRLDQCASEGNDVLPVAEAIRHLMFHGDFTAHGAGAAQSKSVQAMINDLAVAVLAKADSNFELYCDREALGPWAIDRLANCPSCGAAIGDTHSASCDVGRCSVHGELRSQCGGVGRHGSTRYWGVYPGTIEALKRGWTIKRGKDSIPDINRVVVELVWDQATEQFVDQ